MVVTVALPWAHSRLLLARAVAALRACGLGAGAAAARLLRRLLLLLLPLVGALARLVPVRVSLLSGSRVVKARTGARSRRLLGLVGVANGAAATAAAADGSASSHGARRALTTLDGRLSESAGWLLAVVLLPLATSTALVVTTVLLVVVGTVVSTAAVLLALTRADALAGVTTTEHAGCLLVGGLDASAKSHYATWRKVRRVACT